MFDLSFYELMWFGIIALVVLGPEKLPQAVRTVGTYYSKFRRTVGTLKAEMEAELDLAETRQQMEKELEKIRKAESDMQKEMAQLRGSMKQFEQQQNSELKKATQASDDTQASDEKNSDEATSDKDAVAKKSSDQFAYGSSVADTDNLPASSSLSSNQDNQKSQDDQTALSAQAVPTLTRPWKNMWFLLGDYDRIRRLPAAPFLPNYQANPLLYQSANYMHNVSTPSQSTTSQSSNTSSKTISPSPQTHDVKTNTEVP